MPLVLGADAARIADPPPPAGGDSLLAALLREQQQTAVERFSAWHAASLRACEKIGTGTSRPRLPDENLDGSLGASPIFLQALAPAQERYYRDLIPPALPGTGEQFAFEVDLDACSGCTACVTACHNLNGLEDGELWRSVGLLHGGTRALPVLQHVTTACHHCVDPACLDGCPVAAYEKDPLTGIVRHLDDQCIGCQYCILKCPYDVPKYSRAKGIVRKCDLCSSRLAAGEAPACVQACPTRAIRIAVVNQQDAIDNSEANLFLPGSPEPGYTLPTTVYKTRRALPANLLPADYYAAAPQHAHWPLVWMLVLTQMSVGALLVGEALDWMDAAGGRQAPPAAHALQSVAAFALGLVGLAASVLHLGRPTLAYRAVIGWRTSWLSREVLAFGVFAAGASAYAALPWLAAWGWPMAPAWKRALGAAVALAGLAGVACSTMIYASTRRAFWNAASTGAKFLLTCLILGIPLALLIRLAAAGWGAGGAIGGAMHEVGPALCLALIVATALKLLVEATVLRSLRSRTFTPLRRTALLMTGALARVTWTRLVAGALGGLALPGLLVATFRPTGAAAIHSGPIVAAVALMLALNFMGEVGERYLFFAAVVAPKMPGAPSA